MLYLGYCSCVLSVLFYRNQLQETNNAISELKDKQYVLLDDINSLRNSRDKVQEDFNMKLALFEGNVRIFISILSIFDNPVSDNPFC